MSQGYPGWLQTITRPRTTARHYFGPLSNHQLNIFPATPYVFSINAIVTDRSLGIESLIVDTHGVSSVLT